MAAPIKVQLDRIRVSEVSLKVNPGDVSHRALTGDIELGVGHDDRHPGRGQMRLHFRLASADGSVEAEVKCLARLLARTGALESLPPETTAALASRLFDKVRAIVATLTDQMGFPPLFLPELGSVPLERIVELGSAMAPDGRKTDS